MDIVQEVIVLYDRRFSAKVSHNLHLRHTKQEKRFSLTWPLVLLINTRIVRQIHLLEQRGSDELYC